MTDLFEIDETAVENINLTEVKTTLDTNQGNYSSGISCPKFDLRNPPFRIGPRPSDFPGVDFTNFDLRIFGKMVAFGRKANLLDRGHNFYELAEGRETFPILFNEPFYKIDEDQAEGKIPEAMVENHMEVKYGLTPTKGTDYKIYLDDDQFKALKGLTTDIEIATFKQKYEAAKLGSYDYFNNLVKYKNATNPHLRIPPEHAWIWELIDTENKASHGADLEYPGIAFHIKEVKEKVCVEVCENNFSWILNDPKDIATKQGKDKIPMHFLCFKDDGGNRNVRWIFSTKDLMKAVLRSVADKYAVRKKAKHAVYENPVKASWFVEGKDLKSLLKEGKLRSFTDDQINNFIEKVRKLDNGTIN